MHIDDQEKLDDERTKRQALFHETFLSFVNSNNGNNGSGNFDSSLINRMENSCFVFRSPAVRTQQLWPFSTPVKTTQSSKVHDIYMFDVECIIEANYCMIIYMFN